MILVIKLRKGAFNSSLGSIAAPAECAAHVQYSLEVTANLRKFNLLFNTRVSIAPNDLTANEKPNMIKLDIKTCMQALVERILCR